MLPLPPHARIARSLEAGEHAFLDVMPGVRESAAIRRIAPVAEARERLLAEARVLVCGRRGYAFVDVEAPRIVVSEHYFRTGGDLDLYLDLLHELTHLRQLGEGFDLWDDRFAYVDRPTEVEAYAVAVEEGRRLGMSDQAVRTHVKNPWMTRADVDRLLGHIDGFLGGGPLPNIEAAHAGAPFNVHYPWRCPPRAASSEMRPPPVALEPVAGAPAPRVRGGRRSSRRQRPS